jgi:hypothetical protein
MRGDWCEYQYEMPFCFTTRKQIAVSISPALRALLTNAKSSGLEAMLPAGHRAELSDAFLSAVAVPAAEPARIRLRALAGDT